MLAEQEPRWAVFNFLLIRCAGAVIPDVYDSDVRLYS